jgi:hypothetical protein
MDRQGRPGSRAPADTGRRNSALQRVDTLHHPSLSSAHTQSPIHHGFNFWRVRALSIRHEAIRELARQCSHCLARPGNTHGSRHGPNRLIFIKRRLHLVSMMQIGWQICTFVFRSHGSYQIHHQSSRPSGWLHSLLCATCK